jgi:peptide/nickel transport system permease protein
VTGYPGYLLTRLGQFALVVFIGINITFIVTHATPIDPVEQSIAMATQYGTTNPEAIDMMRRSLKELYGLEGGLGEQYIAFWRRIAVGDFGPSLSAFPTPVATLIGRALPWTVALLVVSTLLTWVLGNLLAGILAMAFHPIPYYVLAFLLLIVFGYLWPVLPISGGYTMNMARGWNWPFIASLVSHAILPVASLALVGLGGWFMGMRSLVSNIVTEDYVAYAELAGVERKRILGSYVMRNALVPQVTGLAMSLGSIFNGAIITEQVFGYPGVGSLLVSAVYAGDYSLVLGITTVSILAVSAAVLLIDLCYPLLDPRVRAR